MRHKESGRVIKSAHYTNGNNETYKIPKKFYKYYYQMCLPETDKEYLEVMDFLVTVDGKGSNAITCGQDYPFKGTGYFITNSTIVKVAFFGEKYGATKLCIPYTEFIKHKLCHYDKNSIIAAVLDFFNPNNDNHEIKFGTTEL